MALPVFFLLLGATLLIGNIASWKVRGAIAARQAIWRTKYPLTGQNDPQPENWPAAKNANMSTGTGDEWLEFDPFAEHLVVRGPALGEISVDTELLDMRPGVKNGRSTFNREWPVYPSWGSYDMDLQHSLLTEGWRFNEMNLRGNDARRIPVLYRLPTPDSALLDAYVDAVNRLVFNPRRRELMVLDNDAEIKEYKSLFRTGCPLDFHYYQEIRRRVGRRGLCELDREQVRATVLQDMIDHVQGRNGGGGNPGVPFRLSSCFLEMYRRYKQELEDMLNGNPPPAAGAAAGIQAQIAVLDGKIRQLEDFQGTLN